MKVFNVADRITELSQTGLLPIGVPGGDNGNGSVNRQFNNLWMRFVSGVSSLSTPITQKVWEVLARESPPYFNR